MTIKSIILSLILSQTIVLSATAQPEVWIQPDRLPDLNIPRAGHSVFYANGELMVAGGHTSGFIPTPTAEYYSDGMWRLVEMVYTHDLGSAIPLSSGQVLLTGGLEKNLGIGQTFVAEMYDPTTRSFEGFGCLDQKRAGASSVELDSGKVYITGNWYAEDGIECYDGDPTFKFVKQVSVERSSPYIFRTAADNAIILSGYDNHGQPIDTIIVDQLKGDPFHVPLFDVWKPVGSDVPYNAEESFIGDESEDIYAYLFPVKDEKGKIAIALVQGTNFDLLPTVTPIPMRSQWSPIEYNRNIIVDRQRQRGYMIGHDKERRIYVLSIDYGQAIREKRAPLTLYYTDPMTDVGYGQPILTPEGNLILTGGIIKANYQPFASVLLFRFGERESIWQGMGFWQWIAMIILLLAVLGSLASIVLRIWKIRFTPHQDLITEEGEEPLTPEEELMRKIRKLIEDNKLYLNSEIKITDIADILSTNRHYISDCISLQEGCTFVQLINRYRIEYAKRLLKKDPNIKITEVYIKSGFANETSFFRVFKTVTGSTPNQWKSQM